MTRIALLSALLLALTGCAQGSVDVATVDSLAPTTPDEIRQLLAESAQPVVLNVWASWCSPCRSEAPLLRAAVEEYGDHITFLGIDVRDSQDGARAFIAEFGLDGFTHLFDPTGAVPDDLGGFGVPLTYFFRPGGDLLTMHTGVIDERTLALQIDELLAGRG